MGKIIPLWEKLFQLSENIRGDNFQSLTHGLSRLSLNQLLLLKSLHVLTRDNPDGIPLKTLAAELKVTPATASEMVDTLVRREILERRHSETDRRAVAIRLQKRWHELFLSHEQDYTRRVDAFFSGRVEERRHFEKTVDEFNAFLFNMRKGVATSPGGVDTEPES